MTIADNLTTLNTIKTGLKQAIEKRGTSVGNAPFASYPALAVSDLPVWVRPADWLAMPTVAPTDEKFVGLHAVYGDSNFVSLQASGAYTVNWGDGVVENFASGVQANHIYDYNNAALNGTECTRGYKQALITVTPQGGQHLTAFDLNKKHPTTGLQLYNAGWLDVVIGSPYFTASGLVISTVNGGVVVNKHSIEHVKITNFGAVTTTAYAFYYMFGLAQVELASTQLVVSMQSMFGYCSSLVTVPLFDTSKVSNIGQMFVQCPALRTVPLFDFGNVTNATSMFSTCGLLNSIPAFNLSKCVTMGTMFYNCSSLRNVPLFTLGALTDASNMFGGCLSLQTIPLLNLSTVTNANYLFGNCAQLVTVPLFNLSAVTNASSMFYSCTRLQTVPLFNLAAATDISNMFYGCVSLSTLPAFNFSAVTVANNSIFTGSAPFIKLSFTGLSININLYGTKLSAAALNEVYTNLPVVSGKTITVTGNWGTVADDPSIATAKGWTVVG